MDLATVDHLLTTTRSVRKRLDFSRPVDPAVIERCIAIALQAPTGSNQQGWHFLVVDDPTHVVEDRLLAPARSPRERCAARPVGQVERAYTLDEVIALGRERL